MESTDLKTLVKASDAELLSLLGMYSLPVVQSPEQTLQEGRHGEFWEAGASVLGEGEFEHKSFKQLGNLFLKKWAEQFRIAICQNESLYKEIKAQSLTQIGIVVGLITSAISLAIPALAPFSGLLTVLGVFIARSGREAFCKMLDELDAEA
jgi:hypothetical protein